MIENVITLDRINKFGDLLVGFLNLNKVPSTIAISAMIPLIAHRCATQGTDEQFEHIVEQFRAIYQEFKETGNIDKVSLL